ncbi:hypothetical protein BS78_09G047600 [Paspalum vaginatum]|nr:hypothetical protein BS78_09G047600 [Paspalum vaginatum]
MEPGAAWPPWNFELPNWTMEPAARAPAPGLPGESESTEKYGSWIQTSFPNNSGGVQLVDHYAAVTHHGPIENGAQESLEVALHDMEIEIHDNPIHVFEELAHEFEADVDMIKVKIHRYPPNIRDLGDWCTVPRIVAFGPYHHGRQELKKAERVKHVAAYHCIRESRYSVREIYDAVVLVADNARNLYDKDVMAGISNDDFYHMMFFDACFLVQFMAWRVSEKEVDPSLRSYFHCNRRGINHDIHLLENQLPWQVVKVVLGFRPLPLEEFVAPWRGLLQDRRRILRGKTSLGLDDSYEPPHLLGLLSAIELAEMGITLTANETTELINMGLKRNGIFAELSLAPLSLDYARANRLVNMAAFELCTVPSFPDADFEDTAVCSYLRILSMLVHREEDVHELRTKGILQGGAGLTNKQALDFFTSLQSVSFGFSYVVTMLEIETYRFDRRMQTKLHAFLHKKKKTIFTVLTTIVAVVSILGTLVGILVRLNPIKAAP